MRNLESRGNEVSEFLEKITEVREKFGEDFSRTSRPGRCSRQSRESLPERGVTNTVRGEG